MRGVIDVRTRGGSGIDDKMFYGSVREALMQLFVLFSWKAVLDLKILCEHNTSFLSARAGCSRVREGRSEFRRSVESRDFPALGLFNSFVSIELSTKRSRRFRVLIENLPCCFKNKQLAIDKRIERARATWSEANDGTNKRARFFGKTTHPISIPVFHEQRTAQQSATWGT